MRPIAGASRATVANRGDPRAARFLAGVYPAVTGLILSAAVLKRSSCFLRMFSFTSLAMSALLTQPLDGCAAVVPVLEEWHALHVISPAGLAEGSYGGTVSVVSSAQGLLRT